MKFQKRQTGTSSDRTYTSSDGGAYDAATEQEFNDESLRLKKYVAVFKVRKGEQIGKKFGVKIKFKYRDNKSGKKKGRPKTPIIQYKIFGGNHAMTDTQAQELYNTLAGKTKNKWLKPVMQTEEWHETPDAVPVKSWWSGYLGFEGYKSIIDPPVGYQMPGGDSDVFKVLPSSRPGLESSGGQMIYDHQQFFMAFTSNTSLMQLYPTHQEVTAAGWVCWTPDNQNNVTIFTTTNYNSDGSFIGYKNWKYYHLNGAYGDSWPDGWYDSNGFSDGAFRYNQTTGKHEKNPGGTGWVEITKSVEPAVWNNWELPSVSRVASFSETTVPQTLLGGVWHDYPEGMAFEDRTSSNHYQSHRYWSVQVMHRGLTTMNNWQNSKITIPFTAFSSCMEILTPTEREAKMGTLCSTDQYPFETTYPLQAGG